MYPLLPWKWLSLLLAIVVAAAAYADDLGQWMGVNVPDSMLVRLLPIVLLALFSGFFGPTGYWAPWRIAWRSIPTLNRYFPDLNGLWVGSTSSNWPTISKLVETAQSPAKVTEQELHDVPEQVDAIAVQITCSLFALRVSAALSSTNGVSHSITAKPWRHQHSVQVHISYIYKQETPDHAVTDEESHLGAADVALSTDDYSKAEGVYWTRRRWRTGRNTAGKLELARISETVDKHRALREYAVEHKARLR